MQEEEEDDWDALRAMVEEETSMIRELRVNGTSVGTGAGAGAKGVRSGKEVQQMRVEVEDQENVVREITISKEEFDPRVSDLADSGVRR